MVVLHLVLKYPEHHNRDIGLSHGQGPSIGTGTMEQDLLSVETTTTGLLLRWLGRRRKSC